MPRRKEFLAAVCFVQAAVCQIPTFEQSALFEKNVRPILVNQCSGCHSGESGGSGKLSVDSRDSLLKGGKSGPAIVPGYPEDSLLLRRVLATDPRERMPKGSPDPLSQNEIAALKAWIAGGAFWPESKQEATPVVSTAASSPKTAGGNGVYPRPGTAEQLAFFQQKVRPIFVGHCYNCHSDAFKEAGGLRVDVGISIFAGGDEGPVIIPGSPERSILIQRVKASDPKKRMPQESKEPLAPEEIATLENGLRMVLRGPTKRKSFFPRLHGSSLDMRSSELVTGRGSRSRVLQFRPFTTKRGQQRMWIVLCWPNSSRTVSHLLAIPTPSR